MNHEDLKKRSPIMKGLTRSMSIPDPRPQRVRKNSWFKSNHKFNNNQVIRNSMKKPCQPHSKKKKMNYRDVRQKHWLARKLKKAALDRQPATPHNTTQFLMNTVHFPTDPHIYEFDNERFPNDMMSHSMFGSMRSMVLNNFKQPNNPLDNQPVEKTSCLENDHLDLNKEDAKSDGNSLEIKDFNSYFPENAYELMKVRSESDVYPLSDAYFERRRSNSIQLPKTQGPQIDIKTLIEEAKHGQNDLENVIKNLVNQIREKDDMITVLKGK